VYKLGFKNPEKENHHLNKNDAREPKLLPSGGAP